MEQVFRKLDLPKKGILVFPLSNVKTLPEKLAQLDQELNGVVLKAIKANYFEAKAKSSLSITGPVGAYDRILLLGVEADPEGDAVNTELGVEQLGSVLLDELAKAKIKEASVILEEDIGGFSPDFVAAHLAAGAKLKSYRFDKYKTKQKETDKLSVKKIGYCLQSFKAAQTKYASLNALAEGVFFARDFISEPPNVLHPESYAERLKDLKEHGVKVEVLGEKQMSKLGMHALLGVGQGSTKESQLVVMQWNGSSDRKAKPLAFVGKGVTFDTGGISIKPSANMDAMKYDMGGSAAVVGLIKALALRKASVNAVGVVGLVENMPDGNAQRPGDIVKSMSGQTIEVLNTDAEGRLVLADALWYTQDKFKPKFMINLATLTGAIVVTLADQYAGLFSNDDTLSERLAKAGEHSGEPVWRLPLSKEYDKMIDSKVADMQNIGDGRGAGSITAGQFLQRFVNETPWAHIDIAGMAWAKKGKDLVPEGAVGFGVRLLDRLIHEFYEG